MSKWVRNKAVISVHFPRPPAPYLSPKPRALLPKPLEILEEARNVGTSAQARTRLTCLEGAPSLGKLCQKKKGGKINLGVEIPKSTCTFNFLSVKFVGISAFWPTFIGFSLNESYFWVFFVSFQRFHFMTPKVTEELVSKIISGY